MSLYYLFLIWVEFQSSIKPIPIPKLQSESYPKVVDNPHVYCGTKGGVFQWKEYYFEKKYILKKSCLKNKYKFIIFYHLFYFYIKFTSYIKLIFVKKWIIFYIELCLSLYRTQCSNMKSYTWKFNLKFIFDKRIFKHIFHKIIVLVDKTPWWPVKVEGYRLMKITKPS